MGAIGFPGRGMAGFWAAQGWLQEWLATGIRQLLPRPLLGSTMILVTMREELVLESGRVSLLNLESSHWAPV